MTPEMAKDWVACLGELRAIPKNRSMKVNGQERYKFADLDDAVEYVTPILAKHHLAHDQSWTDDDRCLTTFTHASGEQYVRQGVRVVIPKPDPQSQGSAASYARRYSLLAALGIATTDDDGSAASSTTPKAAPRKAPARPRNVDANGEVVGPSQAQTKKVMAMFAERNMKDRSERLAYTSACIGRDIGSWNDVTAEEARAVIDVLEGEPVHEVPAP